MGSGLGEGCERAKVRAGFSSYVSGASAGARIAKRGPGRSLVHGGGRERALILNEFTQLPTLVVGTSGLATR